MVPPGDTDDTLEPEATLTDPAADSFSDRKEEPAASMPVGKESLLELEIDSSASDQWSIVGGGLSGGLLAWFLHYRQPNVDFVLYEAAAELGGDHTWSFHESDVSEADLELLRPLISKSWSGHSIRFPKFEKEIDTPYHSIRAVDFHRILKKTLGSKLKLGKNFDLSKGRDHVIDARGFDATPNFTAAYQKFVGHDVLLKESHGLKRPLLMDATVKQLDGLRFICILPWDEKRLLVEDTRYSVSKQIDKKAFGRDIDEYIHARGWEVDKIECVESGSRPLPLSSDFVQAFEDSHRIGVAGGFFQPVTGYSFPDSVKTAAELCDLPEWDAESVHDAIQELRDDKLDVASFYTYLNRLLFLAAEPSKRYQVLQAFYRQPQDLVQRFYRGELSSMDQVRILAVKPPVSILRAIRQIWS